MPNRNDKPWLDALSDSPLNVLNYPGYAAGATEFAGNALSNIGRSMSPVRFEDADQSPTGQAGFVPQIPPMITETTGAWGRLFNTPGGEMYPGDMNADAATVALALYGGNALNPFMKAPRGSVASGAMKEGAGGLPMDHASRMQRAKEMGFDTSKIWYHGTDHVFDKFDNAHLGKQSGGGDTGNPMNDLGHFFTDDADYAAMYGENINQVYLRGQYEDIYNPLANKPEAYEMVDDIARHGKYAKLLGQDGVTLTGPGTYPERVVFDPSNIRSVNAAFDPARAGENGLLLSDNKPSILGSALATAGRDIDGLGYYSGALEAAKNLRQAKGTPEQMLAMLKKEGAKQGEIDATGLGNFLSGKTSVTKDDLINHLQQNRLQVKEKTYGETGWEVDFGDGDWHFLADLEEAQRLINDENGGRGQIRRSNEPSTSTKWSAYSLDPSNPTYRETVLHLPNNADKYQDAIERLQDHPSRMDAGPVRDEYRAAMSNAADALNTNFQSGHFPEPNIIGHMMTSLNEVPGGGKAFTLDQIQSDWGQKLRDGGGAWTRERIEALTKDVDQLVTKRDAALTKVMAALPPAKTSFLFGNSEPPLHRNSVEHRLNTIADGDAGGDASWTAIKTAVMKAGVDVREFAGITSAIAMKRAELSQGKALNVPGHPLVNTTDQWTTTTLRNALRQAAEAEADHIAIPSGDTVLGYNPGDTHGMNTFYNDIVPKNLGNILKKYDRNAASPRIVDTLKTPNNPSAGKGFSIFDLSPEIRNAILSDGMPLFSDNRPSIAGAATAPQYDPELEEILKRYQY